MHRPIFPMFPDKLLTNDVVYVYVCVYGFVAKIKTTSFPCQKHHIYSSIYAFTPLCEIQPTFLVLIVLFIILIHKLMAKYPKPVIQVVHKLPVKTGFGEVKLA